MNRREFLKRSMLAATGIVVGGTALSGLSGCQPKKKEKRIGLQLYSVREMMKADPKATLETIAGMGYKELETAGYSDGKLYGFEPKEFGQICADLGMSVSSCHTRHQSSLEDEAEVMAWWDRTFDDQLAAGCRYVFIPSMPIPATLDELKAACNQYNRLGEMANGKGLALGFHNHAREFEKIEEEIMYDYMIANTDPDKFNFQMDVYWVLKGGYSPVDYLQKYAGRFPVLHIKDESIIGESGALNFKEIFEAAYNQGMKDFYVEVEQYTQPVEVCVERSFDYLSAAEFVK